MNIKQKVVFSLLSVTLVAGALVMSLPVTSYAANSGDCQVSILPKAFCNGSKGEGIWLLLNLVINIMTAGVVILAIGGVAYASILYASAGGDSGQIKKAKEMLRDVVVGVAAFALMYSFLQYIIPGGAFSS